MKKRYITSTYGITDSYKEILLNAKDADVKIVPSDDGKTELVIFEKRRRPYEVSVLDGELTVKPKKAKWYNFLRIGIDRSQISICVPREGLCGITVKSNVGDVEISSVCLGGKVDIQVNTAKAMLENVSCSVLNSKGNTGSVLLQGCIAKENVFIKRNTGKVVLNDCVSPEIAVKTNTGMVLGRLAQGVVFDVRTNTGRVEIPTVKVGETVCGRCEIKTNTGSVKFE